MNIKECLCVFSVIITILIALLIIIGAPAEILSRNSCNNINEISGYNTLYKTLDGCYVEYNNKYIKYSEFIARVTTNAKTK